MPILYFVLLLSFSRRKKNHLRNHIRSFIDIAPIPGFFLTHVRHLITDSLGSELPSQRSLAAFAASPEIYRHLMPIEHRGNDHHLAFLLTSLTSHNPRGPSLLYWVNLISLPTNITECVVRGFQLINYSV